MNSGTADDIYRAQTAELYDSISTGLDGDVAFYVEEAVRAGSPVLEIGAGTGRILVPIAEAGIEAVGLDASETMLAIAQRKVSALPAEVGGRIELVQADMRRFDLGRRFSAVLIPYRAFLHLLTVEDQIQALTCIRDHLREGGRLILNFFDPRLEILAAHSAPIGTALKKLQEASNPANGNRIVLWDTRQYDCERQVLTEDRVIEEIEPSGEVVSRRYATLTLRFVYRYEMEHLLERCGFAVENLYGDFNRGRFRYGAEQVWVARRR